jgi:hypothetical protein
VGIVTGFFIPGHAVACERPADEQDQGEHQPDHQSTGDSTGDQGSTGLVGWPSGRAAILAGESRFFEIDAGEGRET